VAIIGKKKERQKLSRMPYGLSVIAIGEKMNNEKCHAQNMVGPWLSSEKNKNEKFHAHAFSLSNIEIQ
jgi:hypothetical protein